MVVIWCDTFSPQFAYLIIDFLNIIFKLTGKNVTHLKETLDEMLVMGQSRVCVQIWDKEFRPLKAIWSIAMLMFSSLFSADF